MNTIDSFVKDKKIIVVGPSKCVFDDVNLINFNDYDLIVRVNHHYCRESEENRKKLGPRTDIVYHSLGPTYTYEDEIDYYNKNNIKVVCRHSEKKNPFPTVEGKRKNINNLYYIQSDNLVKYSNMMKCNIQTGNLCILELIENNAKIVTVIGFDFYTKYLYSYNNDNEIRQKHIDRKVGGKAGNYTGHDPLLQLEYFKKELFKKEPRFNPVGELRELLEMK